MKKTIITISTLIVLMFTVVVLTGCGENNNAASIIGSWAHDSFVYTFNDDKTGSYNASGVLLNFTYEVKDGKVSILYTGNTAPSDFEFKVDGNKLIIKDSFGNDVEYIKK